MFISHHWLALRLGIGPNTKVLDIGGSGARFEHGQVTIIDIAPPTWQGADYLELDVCSERLPFADKEFDVCLCTHTLEDLHHPFLAMDEMQRVAKRGYIETPHRGLELSFEISADQGSYPGWGHHHWMFETVSWRRMRLIPKVWNLMRYDAQKVAKWFGPSAFEFFWNDGFEYEHLQVMNAKGDHWHPMLAEHNDFVRRHRHLLLTFEDLQQSPARPGLSPQFAQAEAASAPA